MALASQMVTSVSQSSRSEWQGPSIDAVVRLRWLGVAGLEIGLGDQTLVIDPYFTRFPVWKALLGRVSPNPRRVATQVPVCDDLLVTHAHWDHVMDVPEVVRGTGAQVYGSSNTCRLLKTCDVPGEHVHEIGPGDRLALGPFDVEVLEARHMMLMGRPVLMGDLPPDLRCPPRARDYRMDSTFSFLIQAGPFRILDWASESTTSANTADVLCVKPFQSRAFFEDLLTIVQPRFVMPVHWDNFFRPLSPPRTCRMLSRLFPGNLESFRRMVTEIVPSTCVVVPEALRRYDLDQILASPA